MIKSTGAGRSITVLVTLSGAQCVYRGTGYVITVAGSVSCCVYRLGLPPTDTAQLLDESPAIQQLVQRFGKRPDEAQRRLLGFLIAFRQSPQCVQHGQSPGVPADVGPPHGFALQVDFGMACRMEDDPEFQSPVGAKLTIVGFGDVERQAVQLVA